MVVQMSERLSKSLLLFEAVMLLAPLTLVTGAYAFLLAQMSVAALIPFFHVVIERLAER